jgi:hypothetical protein
MEKRNEDDWLAHELHGETLRYWMNFLTTDRETGEDTGHLQTPCSRYGRNSREVAPWAIACEVIFVEVSGDDSEDDPRDGLNFYMGLAVNDSPEPEELVREYRFALPIGLSEIVTLEEVQE